MRTPHLNCLFLESVIHLDNNNSPVNALNALQFPLACVPTSNHWEQEWIKSITDALFNSQITSDLFISLNLLDCIHREDFRHTRICIWERS